LAYEFKFPDVGEGITEGEVVKWHVEEGQLVEEDQVLLEVETDKAVVEIPSPVSGVIQKRLVNEGEVINVGDVMLVIGDAGEEPVRVSAKPEKKPGPEPREFKVPGPALAVAAAPATRRLAREMGVDLRAVRGTGPGGRVTPEDVKLASQGGAPDVEKVAVEMKEVGEEGVEERVKMRGVRKRVSEAMVTSVGKIPHVTHVDEVEVTRLIRLRRDIMKRWGEERSKLSYLPFIIKAVALTLKDFPAMNASVDDVTEEIIYKKYYNIGMATATPDGLIVPVIKNADRLSILELSDEIDRLAEATRTRKVPLDDLHGATFSITNYGSIGGLFGTPIIHHPETAILGIGSFFKKVVLVDGQPVERDFAYFSLSFDHRVADGADSAEFVNDLKKYFEIPETYFMELI
jgi:pyruvate dehydrogenase E2 component (dihydrolipoamide acetyltransferase)